MCPRDWRARIEDILESIYNLDDYTRGMTFKEFLNDKKTMKAAAYEIGIIGEAARYISDEVKKNYPQVPWEKMQAIRNVVIHQYFRIDPEILWRTIKQNLPPLVTALQEILKKDQ